MRGIPETAPTPRPRPGRGLTEDDSEPSPVASPYIDAATLHELRMSLPALARAVPSRPDRPGDIVAPVEMDSFAATDTPTPGDTSRRAHQPSSRSTTPPPPARDPTPGPFELYGSVAYPCPPLSSHLLLDSPASGASDRRRT